MNLESENHFWKGIPKINLKYEFQPGKKDFNPEYELPLNMKHVGEYENLM